jgi:hypothetical protein
MENDRYFKVKVKRKVLYIADTFSTIFIVSVLVFIVFNFIHYPFKNVDPWTQSRFFNQFYPKVFTFIYIGSLIIAVISFILSLAFRVYTPAIVYFGDENIQVRSMGFKETFPIGHLKYVIINNATTLDGVDKEKLTAMFETKKHKTIKLRLCNYSEGDAFIKNFLNYPKLDLRLYEFPVGPSESL